MRKTKKALSVILCIAMILSLCVVGASAEAASPLPVTESIVGATAAHPNYYNVLFANGQDVTVAPDSSTGLLVTVGDTTYSYPVSSVTHASKTSGDNGLTIIAGFNNSTTETVPSASTITVRSGAKVGAIFAGSYMSGPDMNTVNINVESGAEAGVVYGGGLSKVSDASSATKTQTAAITIDGSAGLVYAGGCASVGPAISDAITFNPSDNTAAADNWVGSSTVTINGTVDMYFGGSFSYGGVGAVNCLVNGTITGGSYNYSALCGTNGYRGTAAMTVSESGKVACDLYCSMRGYVGDTRLTNKGVIDRVSLNPDGKEVSSYGNVYVDNTGTITMCNLDCGCAKTPVSGSSISPYPHVIYVDGNVTVSTAFWESNTTGSYTAQPGQAVILVNGAGMKQGEAPISNLAVAERIFVNRSEFFTSVNDAVDIAAASGTDLSVKMLADSTEDVTIKKGANVTLDLNGKTLTNAAGDTITNKGTLTITGSGTVDNVTNGKGALVNLSGTVTVTGGATLTRSAEGAGNSWYTVKNLGAMTIDNASVKTGANSTGASSLIDNGWYSASSPGQNDRQTAHTGSTLATLTIVNGTFVGGMNTVKNDDCGKLTIKNGSFSNTTGPVVLNWNDATIDGGTFAVKFTSKSVLANGFGNADNDKGLLTVTGGTFTAATAESALLGYGDGSPAGQGKLTVTGGKFTGIFGTACPYAVEISGGYFTADPSAYVAQGKAAVPTSEAGYNFTIGDVKADVVEGKAEAAAPVGTYTEGAVSADAAKTAAATVTSSGLAGAAGSEAQQVNEATVTTATSMLANEGITPSAESTVVVVVEPYLQVQPAGSTTTDSVKTVTFNIEPMCKVIATTSDVYTSDPANIVVGQQSGNNAVVMDTKPMTVSTPVKVSLTLPADFAAAGSTVYIKHEASTGTYWYKSTVGQNGSIAFTTREGFSPFTISTANDAAAEINDVGYASLQDAVNAVQNGQSIKVLKGSQSAVVSRTISFTLDENGQTGTSVTAGANTTRAITGTTYSFTYTAPASTGTGSVSTYAITAAAGANGAIAPNGKTDVASGKDQVYTITPNKGYTVSDVLVDGKSVGAVTTYTFKNVTAAHTISVTFKAAQWVNHFTDVKSTDWYYDAVKYVNENGLFAGTSDTAFSPTMTMTRGMLVTVLYGMAGKPDVPAATTFSDVAANAYYAKAVAWAAANKLVTGYTNGKFGPNDPVTREQMVTILYGYAAAKGYDVQKTADLTAFPDASSVAAYAVTSMKWAVANGLIAGSDGKLMPGSGAQRAQVAAILASFCKNIVK